MKRKIMVIGMAGSALKSVTDKLESDGNEVKVVDDLDNVPEILKGKYYEETRTVLASESIEIKQADELLTQLRIKAANEIKITERELYDVQMLLCKAIDFLSLPPSKEVNDEEIYQLAQSCIKHRLASDWDNRLDALMREYIMKAFMDFYSRLSNVKEGVSEEKFIGLIFSLFLITS